VRGEPHTMLVLLPGGGGGGGGVDPVVMCRVWFCQFVDIGGLCYMWILSPLNGTLHILYLGRMLRVAVCCVVM
jgi:hypothetical protein